MFCVELGDRIERCCYSLSLQNIMIFVSYKKMVAFIYENMYTTRQQQIIFIEKNSKGFEQKVAKNNENIIFFFRYRFLYVRRYADDFHLQNTIRYTYFVCTFNFLQSLGSIFSVYITTIFSQNAQIRYIFGDAIVRSRRFCGIFYGLAGFN